MAVYYKLLNGETNFVPLKDVEKILPVIQENNDDNILQRMFLKYIDNVFAYVHDERIMNGLTGQLEIPDEKFMRSIEEKIDVDEKDKDNFRRLLTSYFANEIQKLNGKKENFKWHTNPQLAKALQAKLLEEKNTIKPGDKVRVLRNNIRACKPETSIQLHKTIKYDVHDKVLYWYGAHQTEGRIEAIYDTQVRIDQNWMPIDRIIKKIRPYTDTNKTHSESMLFVLFLVTIISVLGVVFWWACPFKESVKQQDAIIVEPF